MQERATTYTTRSSTSVWRSQCTMPHSKVAFHLSWGEAERLSAAAARLPKNRASGASPFALLLMSATMHVAGTDPKDAICARLASDWRATGLVTEHAAASIADSIVNRSSRAKRDKKVAASLEQPLAACRAHRQP